MTVQERFAPPSVRVEKRTDGSILISSTVAMPGVLPTITERLADWAARQPGVTLIAERRAAGWRELTYKQAIDRARSVAGQLRKRKVGQAAPLLIIANASVDQLVLRLGAMLAGVPFVPVSPGLVKYGGKAKLLPLLQKFSPGLIAVSSAIPFSRSDIDWNCESVDLDEFVSDAVSIEAASEVRALHQPAPDDLVALFLTSGSTGVPKAVCVTHRMISYTQASYNGVWPFLEQHPPVLLDWLPWHHTFGGNDNIHKIIWNGGTYFVDDGAPSQDGFERSVENMTMCSPTIHFNVPKGLDQLVSHLEKDFAFGQRLFQSLDCIFFAAAGLSNHTWKRLIEIKPRIEKSIGREVSLLSGYGASESGSIIALVHYPVDRPSNVGLPVPGAVLKLVPNNGKLEARVKGPAVMRGYYKDEERTAASFDEEGFYRTGDALRFVDEREPQRGLLFDGRIGEDFKLASGTWVSVGPLRATLLSSLRPLITEVVVAGHDRDAVGVLLFLDSSIVQNRATPDVRRDLMERIRAHNAANPSSSVSIRYARVETEPLDVASGEVTDKGSVNQRAVLERRADVLDRMFAGIQEEASLTI